MRTNPVLEHYRFLPKIRWLRVFFASIAKGPFVVIRLCPLALDYSCRAETSSTRKTAERSFRLAVSDILRTSVAPKATDWLIRFGFQVCLGNVRSKDKNGEKQDGKDGFFHGR